MEEGILSDFSGSSGGPGLRRSEANGGGREVQAAPPTLELGGIRRPTAPPFVTVRRLPARGAPRTEDSRPHRSRRPRLGYRGTRPRRSRPEPSIPWQTIAPPGRLAFLDRVRSKLRIRHMSVRTEQSYVGWIRRYIHHHGIWHPDEMGAVEVVEFLSHLAVERNISASTQNQALSALVFLYREVLGRELVGLDTAVRARAPRRIPVVLSRAEVRAVLAELDCDAALVAGLLHGAGLRLPEGLRLRIKDLDPARHQILLREGKGDRDRATLFPTGLQAPLARHLERVRKLYELDRRERTPGVEFPHAIDRKLPRAGSEWGWQWVFPAAQLSRADSSRTH